MQSYKGEIVGDEYEEMRGRREGKRKREERKEEREKREES